MFVYRQNRYSINLIKINCHLSLLQTTVKPVYTEPCIKRTLQIPMSELSIMPTCINRTSSIPNAKSGPQEVRFR
jgi:hypothetical protein